MPQCVGVDINGFLVATVETYPECSQFAVVEPAHLERLTYWADLAVAIDPTINPAQAWPLYAATLGVFATAWGIKQVIRLILNR